MPITIAQAAQAVLICQTSSHSSRRSSPNDDEFISPSRQVGLDLTDSVTDQAADTNTDTCESFSPGDQVVVRKLRTLRGVPKTHDSGLLRASEPHGSNCHCL